MAVTWVIFGDCELFAIAIPCPPSPDVVTFFTVRKRISALSAPLTTPVEESVKYSLVMMVAVSPEPSMSTYGCIVSDPPARSYTPGMIFTRQGLAADGVPHQRATFSIAMTGLV